MLTAVSQMTVLYLKPSLASRREVQQSHNTVDSWTSSPVCDIKGNPQLEEKLSTEDKTQTAQELRHRLLSIQIRHIDCVIICSKPTTRARDATSQILGHHTENMKSREATLGSQFIFINTINPLFQGSLAFRLISTKHW